MNLSSQIRLVAFDLDGTLTQHKSKLEPENRAVLDALGKRYRLLMVGAGNCMRIFHQMNEYPIDIIGNYGMQQVRYDAATAQQIPVADEHVAASDRASIDARITQLRNEFGFTEFAGENVEFHDSGVVTFPILGTAAQLADKLAYDPDRKKRRVIYPRVCEMFPEFTVFVGGTSSFDMAPKPFCKSYALTKYCEAHGIPLSAVAYCGDDYGPGGNDEDILNTEAHFIRVDDYRRFPEYVADLLK